MRAFVKSWWPLILIAVSSSAILSGYLFAGLSPPVKMQDLMGSFYWLSVLVWIQMDARHRRRTPCFDFGFFLLATAPLSILWYVCSSRGFLKGLLVILWLLFLASLPDIVLQIVWDALYG